MPVLSISRWVIHRLLCILLRTIIPQHDYFRFQPKYEVLWRIDYREKLKVHILLLSSQEVKSFFTLFFFSYYKKKIKKNRRPSAGVHAGDLVLLLIGFENGVTFLN